MSILRISKSRLSSSKSSIIRRFLILNSIRILYGLLQRISFVNFSLQLRRIYSSIKSTRSSFKLSLSIVDCLLSLALRILQDILSSLQSLIKRSLRSIRSIRVSNSLLLRLSISHSRLQTRSIMTIQTSNSIRKSSDSASNLICCCTSFLYNAFCRSYSIVKSRLLLSRSILIRNIIPLIFCFCELCYQLSLVVTVKFINSLSKRSQRIINSFLLLLRSLSSLTRFLSCCRFSISKSRISLLQSRINSLLLCFRSILILSIASRLRVSRLLQLLSLSNFLLKSSYIDFAIKSSFSRIDSINSLSYFLSSCISISKHCITISNSFIVSNFLSLICINISNRLLEISIIVNKCLQRRLINSFATEILNSLF